MKFIKKLFLKKSKLIKNKKNLININYKIKLNELKLYNNTKKTKLNLIENYELIESNMSFDNNIFYTNYISNPINEVFSLSKLHTFDSYLTSIELINYEFLKKKFNLKYKYSMLSYFIPFLIKNGKKLSTINNMHNSISNIYYLLKYTNNSFETYKYAQQFKHYIDTTDDVYNINFLLHWIINIYKPVFDIKCFNVPKIHKKKGDKNYLYKILYLSDKNRLKTAFKHISIYIKKDSSTKISNRIQLIFLDMLLNYKNSYLYLRKMNIYQQALEL